MLSKEVKFNLDIDDYFKDGKFKWFLEENIIETNSKKQLDINLIILEDKLLALRFIKMKKK